MKNILGLLFLLLLYSCIYSQSKKDIFIENSSDVHPWTNLELNNNSDNFQFIIVSDRTGGMRPGVFKKAVEKINLLHPEFVISVGDLIDGYTKNIELMENQWDEFDNIVSKLQMPFFYLAGNHDISNPEMFKMWRERLGPDYYHFIYKNVLFLCLNTEEGSGAYLGDTQIGYFKNVLSENTNVRWTIVLLHRPLWDYNKKGGYEKIEKLLLDRPYTVFSGHHHNYLFDKRGDTKHFVLGTTGGGSSLRGAEFGELDHLVWVTMTDGGPVIANLELDGIKDEEIVVKEDYPLIQQLCSGSWLKINPAICESNLVSKFFTNIQLINNSINRLHVFGKIESRSGIRFVPDSIDQYIAPNSTEDVSILLESIVGSLNLANIQPLKIELTAESLSNKGKKLTLASSAGLLLDWKHDYSYSKQKIELDGLLNEWENDSFLDVRNPQDIKEDWDWHGEDDSWYRFAITSDKSNLYLALEAFDQDLILGQESLLKNQDKFIINLKSDSTSELIKLFIAPDKVDSHSLSSSTGLNQSQIKTGSLFTKERLTAEIAIPLGLLNLNGEDQGSFRLNVAYMDHDNINNTKPSVLWWRPVWGSKTDYKESGTFYLKTTE